MNRNRKFHKVFCTFALMLILFVFLVSCSTTNGLFGHLVFWDNHTYDNEPNNKELTHFFSSVRPPLGNPDSHYLLATYYQERNNHKEAVKEFKKIIVIDPGYVKAYNGLGVSLDTLGFTQKAVTYYHMALDLNPELDYVLNKELESLRLNMT